MATRPAVAGSPVDGRQGWVRPTDEATLIGLVVAGWVVLAIGWWLSTSWPGSNARRWVDADTLPPRALHFELDVNRTPWPELAVLPGVGPTLARRIVAYRGDHGPFSTVDELLAVRGIGPKKLAAIRPYLTTNPPASD